MLQFIAQMSSVDIVEVEWLHGRVHRVLTTQKVQTHVPSSTYLSSQMVCQRVKLRKAAASTPAALRRRTLSTWRLKHPRPVRHHKRKHRGGGGAWRTWTSKRLRGQEGPADWAELAAEYRIAKQERRADYMEALEGGQAATETSGVSATLL